MKSRHVEESNCALFSFYNVVQAWSSGKCTSPTARSAVLIKPWSLLLLPLASPKASALPQRTSNASNIQHPQRTRTPPKATSTTPFINQLSSSADPPKPCAVPSPSETQVEGRGRHYCSRLCQGVPLGRPNDSAPHCFRRHREADAHPWAPGPAGRTVLRVSGAALGGAGHGPSLHRGLPHHREGERGGRGGG